MYEDEDMVELQRARDESFWCGQSAALENLEADFKWQSGQAFSIGQDEQAKILRTISIYIGKKALDAQKRQKDFQKKFTGGL